MIIIFISENWKMNRQVEELMLWRHGGTHVVDVLNTSRTMLMKLKTFVYF